MVAERRGESLSASSTEDAGEAPGTAEDFRSVEKRRTADTEWIRIEGTPRTLKR